MSNEATTNTLEIIIPGETTTAAVAPPIAPEAPAAAEKRTRDVYMYNGVRLTTPEPNMKPLDVLRYFRGQYPELINATVQMREGSTVETATSKQSTWDFVEGVGPKPAPGGGTTERIHDIKRSTGKKG